MSKATKQANQQDWEKEYGEIMNAFPLNIVPAQYNEQWKAPTDFFIKFSLYEETTSGTTSSNTSLISNPLHA